METMLNQKGNKCYLFMTRTRVNWSCFVHVTGDKGLVWQLIIELTEVLLAGSSVAPWQLFPILQLFKAR